MDTCVMVDVVFYLKELRSADGRGVGHWQVLVPHCDVLAAVDLEACHMANVIHGVLLPRSYGEAMHARESGSMSQQVHERSRKGVRCCG